METVLSESYAVAAHRKISNFVTEASSGALEDRIGGVTGRWSKAVDLGLLAPQPHIESMRAHSALLSGAGAAGVLVNEAMCGTGAE